MFAWTAGFWRGMRGGYKLTQEWQNQKQRWCVNVLHMKGLTFNFYEGVPEQYSAYFFVI